LIEAPAWHTGCLNAVLHLVQFERLGIFSSEEHQASMTLQALYTAATGMNSLETKLDVISNNLANVNTTAFKASRAEFCDLFYQQKTLPGYQDAAGNLTPTGIAVGLGVRVSDTLNDFTQGSFLQTGGQFDTAIQGKGFYQVQDPSGQIYYTRAGNFAVNAVGQLVTASAIDGRPLQPAITIPQDALNVVIGVDGKVQVQQYNNQTFQQVGQLQLVNFQNPEGLLNMGQNLYAQTDASGQPLVGNPGQNGLGSIQQGMLEQSNVQPVNELVNLITTQRSFELNSQMVQAGDQLLQLVANLRRY
jgi:flagellar basal-body rod protein FlgG